MGFPPLPVFRYFRYFIIGAFACVEETRGTGGAQYPWSSWGRSAGTFPSEWGNLRLQLASSIGSSLLDDLPRPRDAVRPAWRISRVACSSCISSGIGSRALSQELLG